MASQHPQDKDAPTERKPRRDERAPSPQPVQVESPLSNDGPELVRDSHC